GLAQEVCPFNPALNHSARGGYFAFLGRVSPEKGLERAIELARRAGVRLRIAAKIDAADEEYFEREIVPLLAAPGAEVIGAAYARAARSGAPPRAWRRTTSRSIARSAAAARSPRCEARAARREPGRRPGRRLARRLEPAHAQARRQLRPVRRVRRHPRGGAQSGGPVPPRHALSLAPAVHARRPPADGALLDGAARQRDAGCRPHQPALLR